MTKSMFAMQILALLARIEEVPGLLIDLDRTKLHDQAADILINIAFGIQLLRSSPQRPGLISMTPQEICMADNMVSTLRTQARTLQSRSDNGLGVTAVLHGLVTGIRDNPAYGMHDPPRNGRFPID